MGANPFLLEKTIFQKAIGVGERKKIAEVGTFVNNGQIYHLYPVPT